MVLLVDINDSNSKVRYSLALFRKLLPRLDLVGFTLFAPTCTLFLLALQFGGVTHPWNSAIVIGFFVASGVLLILFVIWESRQGEDALIPRHIFKGHVLLSSALYNVFLSPVNTVTSLWMPVYFQAVKGVGPTTSGVNTLPSILSQILLAVIAGAAVSKFGYYLPWATLGSILAAIGCGLMSTMDASTSTAAWAGFLFVAGAGRGAGLQIVSIVS